MCACFPGTESERASAALSREGWPPSVVFADDGTGNLAVVLTGGELAGLVSIWDHEEPIAAPAFSSLAAFLAALLVQPSANLVHLEREYPRVQRPNDATAARERALFERTRDRWARGGAWLDAWVALALTPADDPSLLDPFLESDDVGICEETCRVMARVYLEAAVPVLERLAVSGKKPNLPLTCLAALRRHGTPEAADASSRLRPHLPEYSDAFFRPETPRR